MEELEIFNNLERFEEFLKKYLPTDYTIYGKYHSDRKDSYYDIYKNITKEEYCKLEGKNINDVSEIINDIDICTIRVGSYNYPAEERDYEGVHKSYHPDKRSFKPMFEIGNCGGYECGYNFLDFVDKSKNYISWGNEILEIAEKNRNERETNAIINKSKAEENKFIDIITKKVDMRLFFENDMFFRPSNKSKNLLLFGMFIIEQQPNINTEIFRSSCDFKRFFNIIDKVDISYSMKNIVNNLRRCKNMPDDFEHPRLQKKKLNLYKNSNKIILYFSLPNINFLYKTQAQYNNMDFNSIILAINTATKDCIKSYKTFIKLNKRK